MVNLWYPGISLEEMVRLHKRYRYDIDTDRFVLR